MDGEGGYVGDEGQETVNVTNSPYGLSGPTGTNYVCDKSLKLIIILHQSCVSIIS